MPRTSTGQVLIEPLEVAGGVRGRRTGAEGVATAPATGSADSPSRITVLPVDILRPASQPRFADRLEETQTLRFREGVHIAAVDAQLQGALNADVVLLDARGVRAAAVYRSVARLRSAGARGIVMLIDPADLSVVAVCTSLGAADFVLSTARPEEVVVRLHRARRAPAAPGRAASATGVPAIELLWRTHEVRSGSTRIALTLRELQLLAALMDRAGEAVPSDDLARLAWGKRAGSGGLTAAYVCSLRKKLAWFGGRFGIRTVRGVGYRFVV